MAFSIHDIKRETQDFERVYLDTSAILYADSTAGITSVLNGKFTPDSEWTRKWYEHFRSFNAHLERVDRLCTVNHVCNELFGFYKALARYVLHSEEPSPLLFRSLGSMKGIIDQMRQGELDLDHIVQELDVDCSVTDKMIYAAALRDSENARVAIATRDSDFLYLLKAAPPNNPDNLGVLLNYCTGDTELRYTDRRSRRHEPVAAM